VAVRSIEENTKQGGRRHGSAGAALWLSAGHLAAKPWLYENIGWDLEAQEHQIRACGSALQTPKLYANIQDTYPSIGGEQDAPEETSSPDFADSDFKMK
jgi:hypothetical protein